MKYGLPIPNLEFKFEPVEFELGNTKLPESTPNIRLWEVLRLNEETPYDVYELELKNKFNYELDMYGDEKNEVEIREKQVIFKKNSYQIFST